MQFTTLIFASLLALVSAAPAPVPAPQATTPQPAAPAGTARVQLIRSVAPIAMGQGTFPLRRFVSVLSGFPDRIGNPPQDILTADGAVVLDENTGCQFFADGSARDEIGDFIFENQEVVDLTEGSGIPVVLEEAFIICV